MKQGMVRGLLLCLALVGCAGLENATATLKESIQGIDLDAALDDLRDCAALADGFVGVVQEVVARVDEVGGAGSVATSDLSDIVDEVSVSKYYQLAEQLGCARLEAQVDLVDRLRQLDGDTGAGDAFLDEMLSQAQLGG